MENWKWLAAGTAAGLGALVYLTRETSPRTDPVLLPGVKRNFVLDTWPLVESALPATTIPTRMLILAHGCFETGYGSGTAAREGNNLFNITAGSSALWAGPTVNGPDTDESTGHSVPITQAWRAYPSVEAGVQDYWSFLDGPRYRATSKPKLIAGDATWVIQLGKDGYYTLAPDKYMNAYRSVLLNVIGTLEDNLGESLPHPSNLDVVAVA